MSGENINRDRGEPCGYPPPTPPDMRVRIRRFDCVMATFYCRVEPFLYTVTPITPPPWTLTLGLQPTLPVQPALFRQISVAYVIPFLSTQLLSRLALRPVGGFHPLPWMVVTPSTTMAAADFCLLFPARQTSPNKVRNLSPDPCRVYMRLL